MTTSSARAGVAVIGAGAMGEALLKGLLGRPRASQQIVVVVRRPSRAALLTAQYGVLARTLEEAAAVSRILVLTVKPQDVDGLARQLRPHVQPDHLVVSVAAGVATARLEAALPAGTPVVRAMPNTPALVGEAMSAISPGTHATADHLAETELLLSALGRVRRVPESQQDAVTALSGSGPAYFFYAIEAMVEAGVLLGLSRSTATDLVTQTALGAATLLRDTHQHPTELRTAVTTPGGTTIEAVRELERHRVRAALMAAVEAAHGRSVELGG